MNGNPLTAAHFRLLHASAATHHRNDRSVSYYLLG